MVRRCALRADVLAGFARGEYPSCWSAWTMVVITVLMPRLMISNRRLTEGEFDELMNSMSRLIEAAEATHGRPAATCRTPRAD
jgi:hypothetical protein